MPPQSAHRPRHAMDQANNDQSDGTDLNCESTGLVTR